MSRGGFVLFSEWKECWELSAECLQAALTRALNSTKAAQASNPFCLSYPLQVLYSSSPGPLL